MKSIFFVDNNKMAKKTTTHAAIFFRNAETVFAYTKNSSENFLL